ncbi:hypothetical protein EPIB2_495 [Tritonibacter mobilis]|nr:hypothetical protein EPIB2_495 [Tritonibacter mobilis]
MSHEISPPPTLDLCCARFVLLGVGGVTGESDGGAFARVCCREFKNSFGSNRD